MSDEKSEVEEFPEKLYCHQCRRVFPVQSLRAKSNTLLTEAALVCPRCRRKLRRMKLKDWYDHYVQGQKKDFTLDTHGFFHKDPPGTEPMEPERPQRQEQRAGQRPGGRPQDSRDPRQRQRSSGDGRRDSRLPRDVKAYRLPKRRR